MSSFLNKLKTSFEANNKVFSLKEPLFLLSRSFKGFSGIFLISFFFGLTYIFPVIEKFNEYKQAKEAYELAIDNFTRKKNLLLSSLEKIKKAPPLPFYSPMGFYKEIYALTQILGIEVSRFSFKKTTFTLKSLRYPAREIFLKGRVYDDKTLEEFLKYTNKGWKSLEYLKVSSGNITAKIVGAVKEERWKSPLPRRF